MMLCHHYSCLFIHTPKTAGQSIEHVFLRLLDLNWQTRAPLLLRSNDRPELGPPRLAHLKAADYVRFKYMTEQQFSAYFKFAFVRNPWDRLVSIYRYYGFAQQVDFKSFLLDKFAKDIWSNSYWFVGPQYEFVCDPSGQIVVDFIGRFETLQADFDQVCRRLGLPPQKVPHVNRSTASHAHRRSDKSVLPRPGVSWIRSRLKGKQPPAFRSYQAYYDDESVQLVSELYKKDIELFGYQFDQNAAVA